MVMGREKGFIFVASARVTEKLHRAGYQGATMVFLSCTISSESPLTQRRQSWTTAPSDSSKLNEAIDTILSDDERLAARIEQSGRDLEVETEPFRSDPRARHFGREVPSYLGSEVDCKAALSTSETGLSPGLSGSRGRMDDVLMLVTHGRILCWQSILQVHRCKSLGVM